MRAIATQNLTKTYGKHRGISQVDLEVQEGERYGFIGPNGAGKSTTIKLLLGFLFPTAGTARIFGKDCVKSSDTIKRVTAYVPSEVRYYRNLTARQIMKTALNFHKMRWDSLADELIDQFAIEADKKMEEFSLGNKKKVAIAAALVTCPGLLILDEPTSGLDPLMQKTLFDVLQKRNETGMTVFMSSHNLAEVEQFCQKAAFIKEGKLIEVAKLSHQEREGKIFSVACPELTREALEGCGAQIISQEESAWRFVYRGEMSGILGLLSHYNIQDLTVRNIDLEDKFLSYYESGEGK
ncbi:ABC transporter ATP-binding protein [Zongyangia hominis]|uniref:ABC transporter ATP-binding protein n=1 Tax=Zongyangia hominis TaxID=2763677 RepID=A0A926IB31_9FIRM|nr:ABC transporter ATP-binding protein [Zongyangia hominis]MBC8569700.1 ABC transporter ATP-binding protein [Zongyangia hominis]